FADFARRAEAPAFAAGASPTPPRSVLVVSFFSSTTFSVPLFGVISTFTTATACSTTRNSTRRLGFLPPAVAVLAVGLFATPPPRAERRRRDALLLDEVLPDRLRAVLGELLVRLRLAVDARVALDRDPLELRVGPHDLGDLVQERMAHGLDRGLVDVELDLLL